MSKLTLHCGAKEKSRDEINKIDPPEGTETWFPVRHGDLLDTVFEKLRHCSFEVKKLGSQ